MDQKDDMIKIRTLYASTAFHLWNVNLELMGSSFVECNSCEIQAGKQLRSVQQETDSPKAGDARGDVMAQIRQGAQLKHVDAAAEQERRKSTTAGGAAGMGGLAGALAKALEERRQNMGIDDSSDDDEDEDEKNEWSD
uniref:WH2 domain-containing protein n=1 Tax=Caenorhabditis japonica TaxID=281687 RepID=A0A8R1EAH8_CAEJA